MIGPWWHRKSCIAITAIAITWTAPACASGEKGWETASSIGAYGLTAAAIGVSLINGDTAGALQAGGSTAAAELIATGLKEAIPEWRPDHSNRKSFPSGHASIAFAAAATIFNREGPAMGIPAMAVASFVGVARVKADKHHWYDCVAGAGIGMASGFLITHRRPERTAMLSPWGDTHGGGISFAMRF